MTNVRTGGGTTGPDTLQMRLLKDQTFIRIFSHLLQIMIPMLLTLHTFIFNGHRFVNCCAAFHFWNCLGLWSPLISAEYSSNNEKKESENGSAKSTPHWKTCPLIIIKHIIILIHDLIFKHLMPAIGKGIPRLPRLLIGWQPRLIAGYALYSFKVFVKQAALYNMDLINLSHFNRSLRISVISIISISWLVDVSRSSSHAVRRSSQISNIVWMHHRPHLVPKPWRQPALNFSHSAT